MTRAFSISWQIKSIAHISFSYFMLKTSPTSNVTLHFNGKIGEDHEKQIPPLPRYTHTHTHTQTHTYAHTKTYFYSILDNGWMAIENFGFWFEDFWEITTRQPLLFTFYDHLTHNPVGAIEKAMKENVFIWNLHHTWWMSYNHWK